MSWRGGGRSCRGFGSTRNIDSRPTRGAPRWQTSSEGARSSSSTTSCSGPTTRAGCPHCSAIADGFDGFVVHLANHDVMLWAVSRAPLAKLQAYKRRMGWTFPWASSLGGDFNFDFNVSVTEEQQREGTVEYNYRPSTLDVKPKAGGKGPEIPSRSTPDGPAMGAAMTGTDVATYARER